MKEYHIKKVYDEDQFTEIFQIKVSDGKQGFSGKTTDLEKINLTRGHDLSSCVTLLRQDTTEKFEIFAKLDCKVSPEAILTIAVALDNKFLFDTE